MSDFNDVKDKFNNHAMQYDSQRRKLIPCFDDFYSVPVSLIDCGNESPRILDIGAGTGLLTSFIKTKHPKAKFTLIDISDKMLDQARERFRDDVDIEYVIADYVSHPIEGSFDVVVSSLSIHHLTDEEKQVLYKKIYGLLKPGGIFVNADQVLGHTPVIDQLYKSSWKIRIENSGLTSDEIQGVYERTKLDKMSRLDDQLQWLKDSGFMDVDCVYKYFNYVVLYARKEYV
ncbi:MAG TPA: SAM-dependent methyltransferase [Clostridiales bacterium]|nr:SAM-dependent methyltransferase [Clostridiales bacterium]